jgi:hypothetical protein
MVFPGWLWIMILLPLPPDYYIAGIIGMYCQAQPMNYSRYSHVSCRKLKKNIFKCLEEKKSEKFEPDSFN